MILCHFKLKKSHSVSNYHLKYGDVHTAHHYEKKSNPTCVHVPYIQLTNTPMDVYGSSDNHGQK